MQQQTACWFGLTFCQICELDQAMERDDEQYIRMGSLLQQGLDAKVVMGHDSCSSPRGKKKKESLRPQGLGERKQLSTHFCVQSQPWSLSIM